jgi:hypothetical protein
MNPQLHKLSAAFRHNVIHVATIYLLKSMYHLQIDGEPQFPNVLDRMLPKPGSSKSFNTGSSS